MQAACHLWPGAVAVRGTGVLRIEFVEDSSLTSEVLLKPSNFSLAVQKQNLALGVTNASVSKCCLHALLLYSGMSNLRWYSFWVALDVARQLRALERIGAACFFLANR